MYKKLLVAALPLLAFVACGPKNEVTKNGTVVIDWDQSKSDRVVFRTGKTSKKSSRDFTATFTAGDVPLILSVHVDYAEVEYQEGSGWIRDTGPVAVTMTVKNNAEAWLVRNGKCSGPSYRLDAPTKPEQPGLVLECAFGFVHQTWRSSWEMIGQVTFDGMKPQIAPANDGKIE